MYQSVNEIIRKKVLRFFPVLLLAAVIIFSSNVSAQLTGTKYIPGDYATVASAVSALNTSGAGAGGVTFNIAANYTETISATISLTATGTAASPVLFQKDPATSGANPLITAYTGGTATPASAVQDGIWQLVGSDYVTISAIDLTDNATNTANPSTMEYGYALYKAGTSNGCQHVTIQNCVITLNRINNATSAGPMTEGCSGIIVINALPLTATTAVTPVAGGANSYNKFYGNTIQNCNIGISLIGYAPSTSFTLADAGNDIGGTSAATGNTVINYGGASAAANAAAGIRTLAQYGLNVSYNTINNNNGSGVNHPNVLRGIYINTAKSASSTITYNTVTVKGGGTTQQLTGIENASGSTAAGNTVNISSNTVTNCTYATATTGNFYGITNSGTPAAVTINNNTVSNNSSAATSASASTGLFYGIYNSGAASSVTITSNLISGNSTGTSTGTFAAICNSASAPALTINSNTLAGDSTATISGLRYSIYNTGSVTATININSNNIGTSVSPSIKFTAANTAAQSFIYNNKGASAAALFINNNNFFNVLYTTATAAANTYIFNSYATRSQAINGNTFNNLNVNISGNITFISNSVIVPATGTQDVNNNAISGSFTKTAGGIVTLFTSTAASVAGSVINNNNNNFSNITLTGGTTMAGWVNTDAGSSTKTIQNNVFSNWITGTGPVNGMNINITGTNNAVTGNTINNISGAGVITGIGTAAGNDKIYSNIINSLSTTAPGPVIGILITAGTNKKIYNNKIYDLLVNNAGGTVSGVTVSGATIATVSIYNNLIGDLRSPITSSSTDGVRGINITATALNSTINVYYNTIYLNASSSGTLFSSAGISHITSTVATTAKLNLRNNIITNTSTPNGAGLTIAYRRSTSTLTNYASTSNNNLFYAGIPSTNRLLYYDGVGSDQFLSTYKARVATRDSLSVTEDLIGTSKFLSTSGSSASFLHLDSAKATQAEGGALNISGISTDFDNQIRQGNAGYNGSGTAPDMGADEINGTALSALSGIYNVGTGQTFTSLTGAGGLFAGVNSLGLSGNVVVNVTSDLTEDGTNVLYQWAEKGIGNYTLTIQPDAPAARLISGNVSAGMIRFSGAKRVVIDGSNGTGNNYLTFRNTNTPAATGTAFTFINGAINNTIKYCNIEAAANAANGVILFSTSTVSGGNSSNTVSNCNINATVASVTGNACIYSSGTAGNENAANIIINNKIFNYRDRAIDIFSAGSKSWTISGNSLYNGDVSGGNYAAASLLHGIRISGGSGYTISNNYIGGNAALAGGTIAGYSSAGILSFQGILLTTTSAIPASVITGNTVANISVSAVPASTTAANVFTGIETNGSGINIGGPLTGDGNTVGSNTVNGSVAITTTTTSNTYLSLIRGINCNSTGGLVMGNQVGGIDINNVGTSAGASAFTGIYVNNATAPTQVNNNVIGSSGSGAAANSIRVLSSSTSTATAVTGISIGSSVTSTVQADGNLVKNVSFLSAASIIAPGGFIGINSAAAGAAIVAITSNTVTKDSIATYTTGYFYGIYNSGSSSTLSINNNLIAGNSSNSATGAYYSIYNNGAVTTAININNNSIGNSTINAFTFSAANSGTQTFISNASGAATAALSISNNNFQGINYIIAGSGTNTYISNTGATLSRTINGNTFTNLNVNTTGSVNFISDNIAVPANGSQNINNNSIVTGFTKKAGGSITLFSSTGTSGNGSIINNNYNNFSNIIAPSGTVIAGWINTDAGSSPKIIQSNTFSNWTGGTSSITAMQVNIAGANNAVTGNIINTISGAGPVTGILTGTGNDNIFSNIINGLFTSGGFAVTGISVSPGGTVKSIYKNKIYDVSGSNTATIVNGVLINGGTTVNIFNNFIGDLRAAAASNADPIRGISITSSVAPSNINVYYNTIYINATSTSSFFGTTGIYHTANATATTATLNLRNNSITNTSAIKGSGYTAAFRRSGAALNNYATTSDNNLFYAGTPGATKFIYWDGSAGDQTLAAYKTRVAARDASSITEDISGKFLSTSGSSPVFLHMNSTIVSAIESGGANITGYTDDFDGQIRAGNSGYTGGSVSPDIGADEVFGIETVPPAITYTPLTNTTLVTNRDITGVSITDASGINVANGTKPRIYYKRSTDANVWLDNTSSTNGWKYKEAANSASPYSFTIDYSLLNGGAAVTAGAIQYFIVAQDLATTANIAVNSGAFAAASTSVALTSAAFPVTGTINSYNIAFAGTYNVGATEIFTSFTKANGLFASVNSAGLMGNTTFIITSDLAEDGTNALNQWKELGAGNYTMTIQPDAATLRTVSGNAPGGLIRFNGADRVTIDGSTGSGKYLGFKNTNTAGTTGTAFTFINGAANNTIRYCDVQAYADAANSVILFGASATAGGNSNNVIDNCTINAAVAANTGNTAIYSAGTAGNENLSNTISNNNVFGYKDRGLDITAAGSSRWVISGNSFYNGNISGGVNYAASSALHGIKILGGSGYSILNNYIGGSAALASGVNAVYSSTSGNVSFQGILLTTSGALPVSDIKGNTIAGISLSSVPAAANSAAFTGIETNGSGINIGGSAASEGNLIGSMTANGSIVVTTSTVSPANTTNIIGINCASAGGVIINNRVSGIDISNIGSLPAPSVVQGIYINNAAAPAIVNNNLVGSALTSNSIRVLPASASATTSLTGIGIGASVNSTVQVNSNRIENISNLSAASSGSFTGINNAAALNNAVITISSDTIQYVSSAANANVGSTAYTGIISSSAGTISNNIINNIAPASTGANAQTAGINVSGPYVSTISGNTIFNLSTASAKATAVAETGTPSGSAVIGILNTSTVAGQIISNNTLSGFSAISGLSVNSVVIGIGVNASVSGNIFNNKISSFTNMATSAGAAICGIMAANGSFNVYNNSVKISNGSNTNGIKIYGINHAAGSNWNYFYNSVQIGGSTAGARSSAFIRAVNSPVFLRNNVFINIRAGAGFNYAISNPVSPANANWSSSACNYNDLYSSNANTTGEWENGAGQTFAQWQALSGGDANSVNKPVSFITSAYDLQPDSIANCNLNNAGMPVTSPVTINTDINNNSRSATTPDLGAYEFNYTTFTITAGNNSPVCSGDSVVLSVNSGTAISPAFVWLNPANAVISTLQNPTISTIAGKYKVTVTDASGCYITDSTFVTINQRPAAHLTSQASLCDSGSVTLNIAVTGTGTITGTLSTGEVFTGTAPLITITENITATTSFSISSLQDDICTAIPSGIPDTVTVTVTNKGDWAGITSNWSDPSNWCGGIVPTSASDVTIPAGVSVYPVITAVNAVNNITIEANASLTVNGTLQVAGAVANSGTFTATNGTIELNGMSDQTLPAGVFTGNTIKNLVISNNTALTGQLNLTGVLSFGNVNNKIFTTNGFFTLASSATETGSVGDITNHGTNTGNSFSGFVTVERYITPKRAFRFLTAPVNATTTIRDNWMEGVYNPNTTSGNINPAPAFGTHITGAGGHLNHFDETITNNPSLFTYNLQTQSWVAAANTDTLLKAGQALSMFVRGSRSTNLNSSAPDPSPTTLRAKGTLVTGTVILRSAGGGTPGMPALSAAANAYSFVANPYASPVDWLLIDLNNVAGTMYIFDPAISGTNGSGGYVAFNRAIGSSGVSSNDSSKIDKNIQSGQAFFVQTTGALPTLTFKEVYKTSLNRQVFREPGRIAKLSLQLLLPRQQVTGGAADALAAYFSDDFNQAAGSEDSYKFTNQDENIAIVRDGKMLSIEGRKPVTANDTLPLRIWHLTSKNYVFKIGLTNFDNSVEGYLEDAFLHTSTKLDNQTSMTIPFSVTADTLSAASRRFRIVFKNLNIVLSTQPRLYAYEKNKGVQLEWTAGLQNNTDSFVVERSADAQHFAAINTIKAKDDPGTSPAYSSFDTDPDIGNNYYRIKFFNNLFETNYSNTANVYFAGTAGSIAVLPNPVEKGMINIQFKNMAKGNYLMELFSSAGQKIYTAVITHDIYSATHACKINTIVASGIYQLQLTKGSSRLSTRVIFK